MINPEHIKQFYNQNQFPGHYTKVSLSYHEDQIKNAYLSLIDQQLTVGSHILDLGCRTGLISNLFAGKYPDCQFTGIDFSDAVDYADNYAKLHGITNVTYKKQDVLQFDTGTQFDIVICQGVLHHIPMYADAIEKIKLLVKPGGTLIVGLYHPNGKLLKKIVNIDYKNKQLEIDQELVPYETSFLCSRVKSMFRPFVLVDSYPKIGFLTAIKAIFNYRNGGLITYVFKKL
jgi:cyclopropane fatty-acyl-phospholipid synthase-like methyltransferase